MSDILGTLTQYPVKTRLELTGPIIVARDAAHARLRQGLEKGEPLPQFFKDHPIYYAVRKTPEGYASGSFGPTTAGGWIPTSTNSAVGGSMVMLPRQPLRCRPTSLPKNGGFYLGSTVARCAPRARLHQESRVYCFRRSGHGGHLADRSRKVRLHRYRRRGTISLKAFEPTGIARN